MFTSCYISDFLLFEHLIVNYSVPCFDGCFCIVRLPKTSFMICNKLLCSNSITDLLQSITNKVNSKGKENTSTYYQHWWPTWTISLINMVFEVMSYEVLRKKLINLFHKILTLNYLRYCSRQTKRTIENKKRMTSGNIFWANVFS